MRGGGWCDGPGKLPVPECPTNWMIVGQEPNGAGAVCLDIFTLLYPFSLWEPARYRLKYCLKEPSMCY